MSTTRIPADAAQQAAKKLEAANKLQKQITGISALVTGLKNTRSIVTRLHAHGNNNSDYTFHVANDKPLSDYDSAYEFIHAQDEATTPFASALVETVRLAEKDEEQKRFELFRLLNEPVCETLSQPNHA